MGSPSGNRGKSRAPGVHPGSQSGSWTSALPGRVARRTLVGGFGPALHTGGPPDAAPAPASPRARNCCGSLPAALLSGSADASRDADRRTPPARRSPCRPVRAGCAPGSPGSCPAPRGQRADRLGPAPAAPLAAHWMVRQSAGASIVCSRTTSAVAAPFATSGSAPPLPASRLSWSVRCARGASPKPPGDWPGMTASSASPPTPPSPAAPTSSGRSPAAVVSWSPAFAPTCSSSASPAAARRSRCWDSPLRSRLRTARGRPPHPRRARPPPASSLHGGPLRGPPGVRLPGSSACSARCSAKIASGRPNRPAQSCRMPNEPIGPPPSNASSPPAEASPDGRNARPAPGRKRLLQDRTRKPGSVSAWGARPQAPGIDPREAGSIRPVAARRRP